MQGNLSNRCGVVKKSQIFPAEVWKNLRRVQVKKKNVYLSECTSSTNTETSFINMSQLVIYSLVMFTFVLSSLPRLSSVIHLQQQSLHCLVARQHSYSLSIWSRKGSSHGNVDVTLASHCFHQSLVLWHVTAVDWWLRAENLPHTCRTETDRDDLLLLWWWLSSVSWTNTWISETERGYWARVLYCLGNTGNRKQPPIHFLIGWNRLQKNCVFSCMATS